MELNEIIDVVMTLSRCEKAELLKILAEEVYIGILRGEGELQRKRV